MTQSGDSVWKKQSQSVCLALCAIFFATILSLGQPADAVELWNQFKLDLAEDYIHVADFTEEAAVFFT